MYINIMMIMIIAIQLTGFLGSLLVSEDDIRSRSPYSTRD